jgi:hypothetical protein
MEPWHELVVRGSEDAVRGFVVGLAAAGGAAGQPVFGRDVGIEGSSLGERLRALFAQGSHHVVLAPAALAATVIQALAAQGARAGLALESSRAVRTGRFHFGAKTPSRDVAATLRRTFRDALPPGVRVESFSEREKTDPGAKGVELYAPAHEYEYASEGDVTGDVAGVLDVRRQAVALDAVQCGPLRLDA